MTLGTLFASALRPGLLADSRRVQPKISALNKFNNYYWSSYAGDSNVCICRIVPEPLALYINIFLIVQKCVLWPRGHISEQLKICLYF